MAGLKIARSWLMAGLVKCPFPCPLVERASFGWIPLLFLLYLWQVDPHWEETEASVA